jgi:TRAP transporter TatT component family protein
VEGRAWSVARREKSRGEFERLLKQALAVDVNRTPKRRLANLIAQRHARALLSRTTGYFEIAEASTRRALRLSGRPLINS